MKKFLSFLFITTLLLITPFLARADLIVNWDTPGSGFSQVMGDGHLFGRAVGFTIDDPYMITDIQTYLRIDEPGILMVHIYGNADGGVRDWPDSASGALYSAAVISDTFAPMAWYGPSNLDWDLPAGAYWAAFEVPEDSTFAGAFMDGSRYMDKPMDAEAVFSEGGVIAGFRDTALTGLFSMPLRVYGDPAPVPEPATMLLLGSGLLGLAGFRRKFRRG